MPTHMTHSHSAGCNMWLWSRNWVYNLQFILYRKKKVWKQPRREKQFFKCQDHLSVLLVLVRWTGIWIEHMQGKSSDLSPQETDLMDSAAKMAYLCWGRLMKWPRSLGRSVVKRTQNKTLMKEGKITHRAGLKHQQTSILIYIFVR